MHSKTTVFVLLGRAGGAKTEAGSFFAKKSGLGIPLVALGAVMRSWAREGHPLARQCVESMKQGKYFSDEWSIRILEEFLRQNPKKFENGFILDGFPCRTEDIAPFERFLSERGLAMGGDSVGGFA